MTVIIRLQNLPWTANALDIRRFFQNLSIPDGGVHIVGGDKGDAFIAFSSDEDARQAMYLDGGMLSDSPIKLLLSSKSEMQNVIAVARGVLGPSGPESRQSNYGQQGPASGPGVPNPGMGQPDRSQPPFGDVARPATGMGSDRPGMSRDNHMSRAGEGYPVGNGDNRFQRGGPAEFDRGGHDYGGASKIGAGSDVYGGQSGGMDRMGGPQQERPPPDRRGTFPERGRFDQPGRPRGGAVGPNARADEFDRVGRQGYQDREFGQNERRDREHSERGRFRNGSQPDFERRQNVDERQRAQFDNEHQQRFAESRPSFPEHREQQNWDRSFDEGRDRFSDPRGNSDHDRPHNNFNRRERSDFNHVRHDHADRGYEEYGRDTSYAAAADQSYDKRDVFEQEKHYDYGPRGNPGENFGDAYREDAVEGNYDHGVQRGRGARGGRFNRGRGIQRGRGQGRFNSPRGGFGRGNFQQGENRFDSRKRGYTGRDQCYVYVTNMPFNVSYKDVRRFFSGCSIPHEGLKLINDRFGNRNGTAFVMFATDLDCHHALKRDGQVMENRTIHVEQTNDEEFETAVDSFVPGRVTGEVQKREYAPQAKRNRSQSPVRGQKDGGNCIVMKNVHYRATRLDIRKFLGSAKIAENSGPHIQLGKDGRPTGTAFVKFDSADDLEEGLKQNRRYFLQRQVDIYPISKDEFERFTDSQTGGNEGSKKAGGDAQASGEESQNKLSEKKFFCVKMRGIPYTSNESDIRDFFSDLEIANKGINVLMNNQGQPTGTALVEFVTSADCQKALLKDNQYMGKRYIEVKPITKLNMMETAKDGEPRRTTGRPPLKSIPELPGIGRPGCTITMSNLPFKVQLEDIMSFLEPCSPIQDSVRLRYSKEGKPTGDAVVAFHNSEDAQRALRELNRKVMMGRPVVLAMAP